MKRISFEFSFDEISQDTWDELRSLAQEELKQQYVSNNYNNISEIHATSKTLEITVVK